MAMLPRFAQLPLHSQCHLLSLDCDTAPSEHLVTYKNLYTWAVNSKALSSSTNYGWNYGNSFCSWQSHSQMILCIVTSWKMNCTGASLVFFSLIEQFVKKALQQATVWHRVYISYSDYSCIQMSMNTHSIYMKVIVTQRHNWTVHYNVYWTFTIKQES